jgi:hypothetical protein
MCSAKGVFLRFSRSFYYERCKYVEVLIEKLIRDNIVIIPSSYKHIILAYYSIFPYVTTVEASSCDSLSERVPFDNT